MEIRVKKVIDQNSKKTKHIITAIIRGILGIATEIGYALSIMLVAFFICVVITSL